MASNPSTSDRGQELYYAICAHGADGGYVVTADNVSKMRRAFGG